MRKVTNGQAPRTSAHVVQLQPYGKIKEKKKKKKILNADIQFTRENVLRIDGKKVSTPHKPAKTVAPVTLATKPAKSNVKHVTLPILQIPHLCKEY